MAGNPITPTLWQPGFTAQTNYERALELGVIPADWTEEQYLASLKGEPGDPAGLQSIVPGPGIDVDNTDPDNPTVTANGLIAPWHATFEILAAVASINIFHAVAIGNVITQKGGFTLDGNNVIPPEGTTRIRLTAHLYSVTTSTTNNQVRTTRNAAQLPPVEGGVIVNWDTSGYQNRGLIVQTPILPHAGTDGYGLQVMLGNTAQSGQGWLQLEAFID